MAVYSFDASHFPQCYRHAGLRRPSVSKSAKVDHYYLLGKSKTKENYGYHGCEMNTRSWPGSRCWKLRADAERL